MTARLPIQSDLAGRTRSLRLNRSPRPARQKVCPQGCRGNPCNYAAQHGIAAPGAVQCGLVGWADSVRRLFDSRLRGWAGARAARMVADRHLGDHVDGGDQHLPADGLYRGVPDQCHAMPVGLGRLPLVDAALRQRSSSPDHLARLVHAVESSDGFRIAPLGRSRGMPGRISTASHAATASQLPARFISGDGASHLRGLSALRPAASEKNTLGRPAVIGDRATSSGSPTAQPPGIECPFPEPSR